MVRAEVKKKGTDTVLGNVWWVLDPLITMLVYVLVMTVIFERSTPDFPLFLLSAMVPFKWFTATVGSSTGAVTGQRRPHQADPVPQDHPAGHRGASRRSSASSSACSCSAVVLLVAYTGPPLHPGLLWLPLIAVVQFVVHRSGFTFLVQPITVFYRDVGIVIGHLMRLLFWVSPILWSFTRPPAAARPSREAHRRDRSAVRASRARYNPVVAAARVVPDVIYGGLTRATTAGPSSSWTAPTPPDLAVARRSSSRSGSSSLVIGIIIFKRLEPAFAKVL